MVGRSSCTIPNQRSARSSSRRRRPGWAERLAILRSSAMLSIPFSGSGMLQSPNTCESVGPLLRQREIATGGKEAHGDRFVPAQDLTTAAIVAALTATLGPLASPHEPPGCGGGAIRGRLIPKRAASTMLSSQQKSLPFSPRVALSDSWLRPPHFRYLSRHQRLSQSI